MSFDLSPFAPSPHTKDKKVTFTEQAGPTLSVQPPPELDSSRELCLIEIRRKLNESRLKGRSGNKHSELMYDLSKTKLELKRALEENSTENLKKYRYVPAMDPHSRAMARKLEGDVVARTKAWDLARQEKVQGWRQAQRDEERRLDAQERAKHHPHMHPTQKINEKMGVLSKVKHFIEHMDEIMEERNKFVPGQRTSKSEARLPGLAKTQENSKCLVKSD